MKARFLRRDQRSQRGAAAVEFALVVVPLLYIIFGIISYGLMLSFRQSIGQAAAEGARAAAVAPSGLTTAQKTTLAVNGINDALNSYGVACGSTSTTGTTTTGALTRSGSTAGTCTISGPALCTGGGVGATAMCMKVALDYTYRANAITPNLGFGVVLPSDLRYNSEVQVN